MLSDSFESRLEFPKRVSDPVEALLFFSICLRRQIKSPDDFIAIAGHLKQPIALLGRSSTGVRICLYKLHSQRFCCRDSRFVFAVASSRVYGYGRLRKA